MRVVIAKHRIVGRQNGAATVTEYCIDTLVSQYLHDDICTAHARAFEWMVGHFRSFCLLAHNAAGGLRKCQIDTGFLASVY
jgi:hypothetical protein